MAADIEAAAATAVLLLTVTLALVRSPRATIGLYAWAALAQAAMLAVRAPANPLLWLWLAVAVTLWC